MVQILDALSSWMLVCSAERMNEEETERAFARPFYTTQESHPGRMA